MRLRYAAAGVEFEYEGDDLAECERLMARLGVGPVRVIGGDLALDDVPVDTRARLVTAEYGASVPDPDPGDGPMKTGRWSAADETVLRDLWPSDLSVRVIADRLRRQPMAVRNKAMGLRLGGKREARRDRAAASRAAASQDDAGPPAKSPSGHRRFDKIAPPADPATVARLADDHPAVVNAVSLFHSQVVDPKDSPRVLVSGKNNRKLGDRVTKGPWRGIPIYHVTLEERATCPRTCHHWRSCYGAGMPLARRHAHGEALVEALEGELKGLQFDHPNGFVVRLHNLGDFYSVDYVEAWCGWLDRFPALRVFGYTAWGPDTRIGRAIRIVAGTEWQRFAIRFSDPAGFAGIEKDFPKAITLWEHPKAPTVDGAVVCPAQTHDDVCCATCGLCWNWNMRDRPIAFIAHGRQAA